MGLGGAQSDESSESENEEDKPSTSTAKKILKKVMKGKRGRPRVKPIATVQLKTKSALKKAKQEAAKEAGWFIIVFHSEDWSEDNM